MFSTLLRVLAWGTACLAVVAASVAAGTPRVAVPSATTAPSGPAASDPPSAAPPRAPAEQDNPSVRPGLVRWHPSFADARLAAGRSGRPVLLFHMMGQLDRQFC